MSPERHARIDAALAAEIAAGRLPGVVLLAWHRGCLWHRTVLGALRPEGPAMTEDAVFRAYSLTKPLTAMAALMLMEEGRIALAEPVADYLPELGALRVAGADGPVPARQAMSVHDLLTHCSGLGYDGLPVMPRERDPTDYLAEVAATPLLFEPGTRWEYGASSDVLGLLVERVSGQRLGDFLAERLFTPLGLTATGFDLSPGAALAEPFGVDPLSRAPISNPRQTFDPRPPARMHSGGAGLLTTAPDYLRLARLLLGMGGLDHARILAPSSVRLMTSDHLGPRITRATSPGMASMGSPGYGFGLGVGVRLAEGEANVPGSRGDYYWNGTAGCGFWVDPVRDLAVVVMAQAPGAMRVRLRRLVRQLIYQALPE